jgi:hypothetical protein
MNDELPPLPPRHIWTLDGLQIRAVGTKFLNEEERNPTKEEIVYYQDIDNNEIRVFYWGKNPGTWVLHSICETKEDAIQVMAALCNLGFAEYKFL